MPLAASAQPALHIGSQARRVELSGPSRTPRIVPGFAARDDLACILLKFAALF
jgi:hypothetical protein